ncbi:MAG: hypothetical protein PUJ25_08355 [Lachnospiraceae bacterium]|nr:hypothetical protein [Lachnospiraceae bacterium]MDD7665588.1 hypothetical protein [Lachnospiraceae bacterium]MDY4164193.1 hypothetical protein [Lachnospiraceae bacterium]
MTEKTELIHDLSVIRHLSKKIDLSDKEQVRAVLLLQRDDGLFKTGYGKRFIARLIDYFTDKPAKNTCIYTGQKLSGLFPVSEDFLALIESSPEKAADQILNAESEEDLVKKSPYILEELRYRQREAAAEEENRNAIKEQEELKKAEQDLEKEEAPYKAVREKAKQAADAATTAANGAKDKAHEFSGAEEGEGNSVFDLFKDIEKPWRYKKIYEILFVIFLLAGYWFIMTKGAGAVPFEMVIGAGLAPVAVVLFFNELMEIYEKSESFKTTLILSGIGSLMSLFFTWATGSIFSSVTAVNVFLRALIEGAVCMLTLLGIVMQHIRKIGKNLTMLQGIYYGSCFGVGFAFYEVCDGALSQYFSDQRPGVFMWHLITQSAMAVGGRIVWCAVIGGAFSVIIKKADVLRSQEFLKMCLLAFIFPFAMQICWDADFMNFGLYGVSLKNIFLMIVDLMVLNLFLHRGIREARKEKKDV